MRLHRGRGCPFCGKTAKHYAIVKRTNPGGNCVVIADCKPKGGQSTTWTASGPSRDGKRANAPYIPQLIRDGAIHPANAIERGTALGQYWRKS